MVLLDVGDDTAGSEELYTGTSTTFTAEVPNEEPFIASLVSAHDGVIADLEGTPHCALPTPSTSTTIISVTVTPTVPPTVPTRVIQQQLDVASPAPYVAPTELRRTGSSTVPLAVVDTTPLGLGFAARRFAARRA